MSNSQFILPLFRIDASGELVGTGFVVAPDRVLTCCHVLCERDRFGVRWDTAAEELIARPGGEDTEVICRVVARDPVRDLALLHPVSSLGLPPLSFVAHFTNEPARHLCALPWHVTGYVPPGAPVNLLRYDVTPLLKGTGVDSELLADLQLQGGCPEGTSGSPVLVQLRDGRWGGLGVVCLGGKRAATTRVVPADQVLAFLHEHDVRHTPIPCAEAIVGLPDRRGGWLTISRAVAAVVVLGLLLAGTGWALQNRSGAPTPQAAGPVQVVDCFVSISRQEKRRVEFSVNAQPRRSLSNPGDAPARIKLTPGDHTLEAWADGLTHTIPVQVEKGQTDPVFVTIPSSDSWP